MKLREGRIGKQEGVCALATAIVCASIFALNSAYAYENGNTSYIWLPLGIGVGLLGALIAAWLMKRSRCDDLSHFYLYSMGPVFGRVSMLLLAAALLYQAYSIQVVFVGALHSYVFPISRYEAIIAWVALGTIYIAYGGLERIGRSAKCVAALAAAGLLAAILLPVKAFSWFRLFPFPGDTVYEIAERTVTNSFRALPAMLCMLSLSGGMQGRDNAKKTIWIAAAFAVATVFLTQLALAFTFTSTQIKDIYMPLFRVDMTVLTGNYYLRQDKLGLFLWFFAMLPAAAYLQYGAGCLFCRATGFADIRPPLLSFSAWMIFAQLWQHSGFYGVFEALRDWMDNYGFLIVWLPLISGVVLSCFKRKKKAEA